MCVCVFFLFFLKLCSCSWTAQLTESCKTAHSFGLIIRGIIYAMWWLTSTIHFNRDYTEVSFLLHNYTSFEDSLKVCVINKHQMRRPGTTDIALNRILSDYAVLKHAGWGLLCILQQANCPLLSLEAVPSLPGSGYDVCGNAQNSHTELISRLGVAMNLCG